MPVRQSLFAIFADVIEPVKIETRGLTPKFFLDTCNEPLYY
jgi:hypothetical protein